MADDYTRGEMDIEDQADTWSAFMLWTQWGSFLIILTVGYATLVLSAGMNWMVAMGLMTVLGIVGGLAMGMGGAWTATVFALVGIGLFVQLVIGLVQAAAG